MQRSTCAKTASSERSFHVRSETACPLFVGHDREALAIASKSRKRSTTLPHAGSVVTATAAWITTHHVVSPCEIRKLRSAAVDGGRSVKGDGTAAIFLRCVRTGILRCVRTRIGGRTGINDGGAIHDTRAWDAARSRRARRRRR